MRNTLRAIVLFLFFSTVATHLAAADVTLPKIFGSHMVLQQDKPIVVWGWANSGEEVTVDLGGSTGKATTTDKGEWKITLPPLKAGGAAMTMNITAGNKITFEDILIGEVWLCSGQSNMEFGLGNTDHHAEEIANANYPQIRLMKVDKSWKPMPQTDIGGEWKPCTPDTVKQGGWNGFSAVAYFYGRELYKQLGVPIGLIDSTWGGTDIQSWTPPQGFAAVPALATENVHVQLGVPGSLDHDEAMSHFVEAVQTWTDGAKKSLADHTFPAEIPATPAGLLGPDNVQGATALFNGMIHPLCPFAIRGAIWYQGENNEPEGPLYTERMRALIGGWRAIWGEGDFPFYFVQIAPYDYSGRSKQAVHLPEFWEAQAEAERLIPNTGMIVVNDIGNFHDIHPTDKQDVGLRLARRSLQDTYGKSDIVGHSPTFKSMAAEGTKLRVTFDNTGTGLKSRDGKPVTWFEIADGDTGVYKKATCIIEGSSVLLSAPEVKHPVAVRFAWAMLVEPNLANSAGFPASSFRAGSIPQVDHILPNVPEAKEYQLAYDLDLSKLGPTIQYAVDNHATITKPFDRIAYAVELQGEHGLQWVYVSTDAFTDDITKIGVPTAASGATFQQNLAHMNVFSNVTGIVTGENLTGGNIEFWPNNYDEHNSASVPNASDTTFDFGDNPTGPLDGYGSMQIHNHDAKQTLFAINHWREGDGADIGIGSSPTGNPDWTFAQNAGSYPIKRLRIFVHEK